MVLDALHLSFLFSPYDNLEVVTFFFFLKKLRLNEIKKTTQSHVIPNMQGQDSRPGLWALDSYPSPLNHAASYQPKGHRSNICHERTQLTHVHTLPHTLSSTYTVTHTLILTVIITEIEAIQNLPLPGVMPEFHLVFHFSFQNVGH